MIRPFKFDKLKKISKRELELTKALYEYLPNTDIREKIHVSIRKSLMKHLGQDIRYYLSKIDRKNFRDFASSLPDNPVLIVLGLTPIDKKAIIQIDSNIANLVIGKLLGGAEATELKPLTETEQGVLQYVIMQVLAQLYKEAGREPRVHFRLEKFLFHPDDADAICEARENVCEMTIEVSLMDQSGFVKIIFPDPFLEQITTLKGGAGNTESEREYFKKKLAGWGNVKTSVWAEAGKSMLSPLELKDLEAGDVILFDESAVSLPAGNLEGDVIIHFGSGEGEVSAVLRESGKDKVKCELKSTIK